MDQLCLPSHPIELPCQYYSPSISILPHHFTLASANPHIITLFCHIIKYLICYRYRTNLNNKKKNLSFSSLYSLSSSSPSFFLAPTYSLPLPLPVHPSLVCNQGSTKSLASLALLADKLKSYGQILTKIMYILSWLCTENVGKGI